MAYSSYISKDTGLPINISKMSTRQLRMYISDQAAEAQARVDSMPDDPSRAFKHALSLVTDSKGNIKKSSSNMRKSEMVERAYRLRTLNSLDYQSKFSENLDWQKNKKRYESFIRNRAAEEQELIKKGKLDPNKARWSKYITEKGNVSKKGYEEYRSFVLTFSGDFRHVFNYETIKKFMEDNNIIGDKEKQDLMLKIMVEVWDDMKGKDYTDEDMIAEADRRYQSALQESINLSKAQVNVGAHKKSAPTKLKRHKARKMKEHGKVHRTSR